MVRAEPAGTPEDLDGGNVGAWREFAMPAGATMNEVYARHVIPAAIDCAREILARMAVDPAYSGMPLGSFGQAAVGRHRPPLRQDRLAFAWDDHPDQILRHIRAAPFGVRTELGGQPVNVYDAHPHDVQDAWSRPGQLMAARPGQLVAHRDGAVLVATGAGGAVWIGHAKVKPADSGRGLKLPAVHAVRAQLTGLRESVLHPDRPPGQPDTHQVIRYRREGQVGWVHAEPYNGAASTAFCGRLLEALQYAAEQDTTAIALVGGNVAFNNGIHLGVIEDADDPRAEAWANIQRIDDVAEFIFNLSRGRHLPRPQTTVAVLSSSAGAGGAVLSACFDVVLARPSINLNYHYGTMGLSGSELRSLVLPLPRRRAGRRAAPRRTSAGQPDGRSPARSGRRHRARRPHRVRPLGQAVRHPGRRRAPQAAASDRPHAVPAPGAGRHVARHLRGPQRVRGRATPLPRRGRMTSSPAWPVLEGQLSGWPAPSRSRFALAHRSRTFRFGSRSGGGGRGPGGWPRSETPRPGSCWRPPFAHALPDRRAAALCR